MTLVERELLHLINQRKKEDQEKGLSQIKPKIKNLKHK